MKKLLSLTLSALIISVCVIFSACSTGSTNSADTSETEAQTDGAASIAEDSTTLIKGTSGDSEDITSTANVTSGGAIDTTDLFTDRDLKQTADTSSATEYTVSDGKTITITEEGIYVIKGTASEAQILVEAADDAKIQIVLNGVSITNTSTPAIYVKSAKKVFVTTAQDSENTLTVTGTFTADDTTNTDAVIFSKDDLVLNGLGTLTISSTNNGISAKDDLKITGGTINVESTEDGIEANNAIAISDCTVTINSGKDGIHCENDEDDSVGYIYICGGTFNITSGSDGIQGTTIVQIDGGNMTLNSVEGIEATYIQINGGTIKISASDDGINATSKSTQYDPKIEINDGNITIEMGQGDTDAFDANGSIIINGGTVTITAQSPFDYDSEGKINGGTVTVNGETVTEMTNQMMGGGAMGGGQMGGQMGGQAPGSSGINQGGGFGGKMR